MKDEVPAWRAEPAGPRGLTGEVFAEFRGLTGSWLLRSCWPLRFLAPSRFLWDILQRGSSLLPPSACFPHIFGCDRGVTDVGLLLSPFAISIRLNADPFRLLLAKA